MLDGLDIEVQESKTGLNLIPIVDMLTTIIFFLLMSTTFYNYTKHTLPPSATAVSEAKPDQKPPLDLKVLAYFQGGNNLRVVYKWAGESPAELKEDFELKKPYSRKGIDQLVGGLFKLNEKMKKTIRSDDKTIRMSMARNVPYQALISIMDSVKKDFPDIVLSESSDAENYQASSGAN